MPIKIVSLNKSIDKESDSAAYNNSCIPHIGIYKVVIKRGFEFWCNFFVVPGNGHATLWETTTAKHWLCQHICWPTQETDDEETRQVQKILVHSMATKLNRNKLLYCRSRQGSWHAASAKTWDLYSEYSDVFTGIGCSNAHSD